ncbi:hypothetical protein NQ318_018305 [Aromia moschata]|uniref:Uncharacterized protein n=1 Tax=Aromia moschata TaxID=1265417 RepID=A0AAV8ZDK9_9CUCU|nr:hypothetical protein NQ318_018305 [Aromia moschata]
MTSVLVQELNEDDPDQRLLYNLIQIMWEIAKTTVEIDNDEFCLSCSLTLQRHIGDYLLVYYENVNSVLSLAELLQIVDDVNSLLLAADDTVNDPVKNKFEGVLKKDIDFTKLRQI